MLRESARFLDLGLELHARPLALGLGCHAHPFLLGGELSGHMFLGENYYPVDDALIAAGRVLAILSRSDKPLSEQFSELPPLYATHLIQLRCPDDQKFQVVATLRDQLAAKYPVIDIDGARADRDTLGGIVEVRARGVPPGLGSYSTKHERLDARLAATLLGTQAVKGVEIGDGYGLAALRGSDAHDEIFHDERGFHRETNRAGGIEAGVSNGEEIVVRAAMKPLPTLMRPLDSVDLATGEPAQALVERSDVQAVEALAEMMGLEVPRENTGQPERKDENDELYALLREADQIYRAALRSSDKAIAYLKKRGIDGPTAGRFGIGYAPDAWDTVLRQLGTSDMRIAKLLRFSGVRAQFGVDVYNLLNTDVVTTYNEGYTAPTATSGSIWLTPNAILPARYVRLNMQLDF